MSYCWASNLYIYKSVSHKIWWKSFEAFLEKMKILNFFLMWTTLNFGGRLKTKKSAKIFAGGALDIEYERDWPVRLGATLGDWQKIKNYFSSFRVFPGKADSFILLGFECTINPQNSIKIVGAVFEKIKNFYFFCHVKYPQFRGRAKTKTTGSRYLQENPRYRILTRSVDWFRLYDRRRTDRQTDIHTFF